MLHTDGSLMGGHELRPAGNGFVVVARYVRLSELDLYGLGLFAPEEVRPFFVIGNARNENGSLIPAAAELVAGARITGSKIDLTIDDVIRAAGSRDPGEAEMRAVFALVTRPNEAATSTAVIAEAQAIDALRSDLEAAWSSFTRSRGSLCTRLAGCLVSETPDAGVSIDKNGGDCGCAAVLRGEGAGHGATERIVSLAPALLLAIIVCVRPWLRCRARGPSSDRSLSSASPRRRGSQQPSR
jgi:hypothetical protein